MNPSIFNPRAEVRCRGFRTAPGILAAAALAIILALAGFAASAARAHRRKGHVASALSNPLNLTPAPTNGNPLSGARFFVDHWNAVSDAARQYPELSVIADQPGAMRFGPFS